MKPTIARLASGGAPDTKHGQYLGPWGAFGGQPQKGITSYSVSANRQRPLAGTAHAAIFNVWRRFRAQALYVLPPFLVAYTVLNWATEKNEYYNSKPGRMAEEEAAAEATAGGAVRG